MSFAEWLRQKIDERRSKPSRIAHYSGLSHAEISRLLCGVRQPSLTTLRKLSPVLRVSMNEILAAAGLGDVNSVDIKQTEIPVNMVVCGKEDSDDLQVFQDRNSPSGLIFRNCMSILIKEPVFLSLPSNISGAIYSIDEQIRNGDYVFAGTKRGKRYIKKYYEDKNGVIILSAVHHASAASPILFKKDDLEFVYRIVAFCIF